jgi:hypothetical protein
LFPAAPPTNGLFQCNTSNVGEMFYLPVVDASRLYNAFFDDKNTLIKQTVATLAHEFQHLISASRRIYINNSDDFETVWLDEGMSHIAEELLYLRIAGFAPKSNLTYPTITASQTLLDDVNFYQIQNFIRFQKFLSAPETHSAYSNDDSLPTRGATWNLLRYLLDQSSGAPNTYTRAIDNQVGNGIPSLNTVFSGVAPSLAVSLRQVAVALFTDDAGFAVTAPYTFPSWNYRSVMPNVPTAFAFSLQTRPLLPGSSQSFTLRGGASSYLRFRVNGNITGSVTPGQGVANSVDLILVRTQ